jgi:hypothetical protein
LVTAYVARPLVPETFGASEALADPVSGQSVDDLHTHFDAVKRLSEYLPYAGYNGAVVNVFADGGAIYPSRLVLATPLYDTGRTIGGGRGAPPPDPLEMMLRVFDREGLALVPAIQLATPLAKLESLRRNSDPQSSGLEWVGADGKTWLQSQTTGRGAAPYYNLLDERVQEAVFEFIEEIVVRYGHHASLAGLTVQLSAEGFAQLPGPNWGFDDATIAQFERDMRVRLSAGDGPGRFAARQTVLSRQYADEWRTWRAARVTRFYARLASLVQSSGPKRRLFLTTEDAFSSPRMRNQLRPNVLKKASFDALLLDAGIDREKLSRSNGIVFCPAQLVEPATPLVDRATSLEQNDIAAEMLRKIGDAGGDIGATFFHRPVRQRLAGFDAKSPWPSSTWLVTQSMPDSSNVRKRYALALESSDPSTFIDGGELLPIGQEVVTRPLLTALQMLPSKVPFRVEKTQPVTMRVYESAESVLVVLINSSPWAATAEIGIDVSRDAEMQSMTSDSAPSPLKAGSSTLPITLASYDVQILKLQSPGARVVGLSASISDKAKTELSTQLSAAVNRDWSRRREYQRLANPSFEPIAAAGALPGWQVIGDPDGTTAELDSTTPHGGTTSLYLASRANRAAVASDAFPTPPTGQLSMTAWLRGEHLSNGSAVRLVIETDGAGQSYRKFADTQQTYPVSSEWKFYGFFVNDLPLDSRGRMRVKFELEGTGEVWVDDVKLYDLLIPETTYERQAVEEKRELQIVLHAAEKAQENGRIADAVRVLESYWPRFLLEYTAPLESVPTVAQQTPIVPTESQLSEPQIPAESPSLFRRMLPGILR